MVTPEGCALDLVEFAGALLATRDRPAAVALVDRLLGALPFEWYVLQARSADGRTRQLLARRCPSAIRNLLADRSASGASVQAILPEQPAIIADAPPPASQTMVCRFSPKPEWTGGPRLEGAFTALLHQAMLRIMRLEAAEWLALVRRQFPDRHDRQLFLFTPTGELLDRDPPGGELSSSAILPYHRALNQKRGGDVRHAVIEADGHTYELTHRWIRGDRRDQPRMVAIEARQQTTITALLDSSFDRYTLTKREREIAQLLLQGLSNQDISARLFVSGDTVKTHCRHLFAKLQIGRRSEILQALRCMEPLGPAPPASARRDSHPVLTFAQRPAITQLWQGRYVRMDAGAAFLSNLKDGTRVRIEKGAVGYCYECGGALSLGFNRDMKPPAIAAFGEPRFDYRVQMEARLVPFLSVSLD